jgi:hypothetical protein
MQLGSRIKLKCYPYSKFSPVISFTGESFDAAAADPALGKNFDASPKAQALSQDVLKDSKLT